MGYSWEKGWVEGDLKGSGGWRDGQGSGGGDSGGNVIGTEKAEGLCSSVGVAGENREGG